ncbi:MAG: hypothetical protein GY856_29340 [bacterium]|nr:hypothetical protein [bacterium]
MDSQPQPAPVRFSPADPDSVRERPVTLRVLVVADLDPGGDAELRRVDKTTFAEVLESVSPSLELRVADHLGTGAKELACSLRFPSLKSFHPDGVARAVPVVADLLEVRRLIESCRLGETELATLRESLPGTFRDAGLAERLQEGLTTGAPASSATATEAIDSLLSKVELPAGTSGAPTPGTLADLLSAAVVPAAGRPAGDRQKLRELVAEIDARVTRQVTAICEARPLRELEAAWRGLKFLIDRTDFRRRIRLEILPASKEDFLNRFFERVFHTEYEGRSEVPLAVVVADYAFDRSPGDLDTLRHAGRMGASLRTPFLASVSPAFWGVKRAKLLATLPDLIRKSRGPEYAKWNRFRTEEESSWLSLAVNRFLLRDAWSEASAAVKSFSWSPGGAAAPLWGSGAWALTAALVRGFAAQGLSFPMAGPQPPAVLEELPLRPYAAGKSEAEPYPLEVRFSDRRTQELSVVGFAPLVAGAGTDGAYFAAVPTFHAPERYDQEEATRASYLASTLPYQAFAAIASQVVERIGRELGGGRSREELAAAFRDALLAFLANAEEEPAAEEAEVEVHPNPEEPQLVEVTVRLRPGFQIHGGDVDLVLGTAVAC